MTDLSEQNLERLAREMKDIRVLLTKVVNAMVDAEAEIPERMRRFTMYMHDVHQIMWMYQENGHEPPEYVKAEARRCDDRYRQILAELHTDTGAFEKVRREMAADPLNRYDHTRQLLKPTHKGAIDETRQSNEGCNGRDEGGTQLPLGFTRGG